MAYLTAKPKPKTPKKAPSLVTAGDIKALLTSRHANDIGVAEALMGSGGAQRFDYWAMDPTWTKIRCCGYEVKVNRSDFINDNKWTSYLDYCTEFYFVCPAGLISVEELPENVGLIWSSATGGSSIPNARPRLGTSRPRT